MQLLHCAQRGVLLLNVLVVLRVGTLRHEVADVLVAAVANRADAVDCHIAAVTGGDDVVARFGGGSEQRPVRESTGGSAMPPRTSESQ